jgi:hypothetical protein
MQKTAVTEHLPFDDDVLVFKVCNKMFALASIKQWESGNGYINLNNAFYFYDRQWKYNQYFNWTEEALETISGFCGLSTGEMQYDDCGCYRPPMWRLFCELRHKEI